MRGVVPCLGVVTIATPCCPVDVTCLRLPCLHLPPPRTSPPRPWLQVVLAKDRSVPTMAADALLRGVPDDVAVACVMSSFVASLSASGASADATMRLAGSGVDVIAVAAKKVGGSVCLWTGVGRWA